MAHVPSWERLTSAARDFLADVDKVCEGWETHSAACARCLEAERFRDDRCATGRELADRARAMMDAYTDAIDPLTSIDLERIGYSAGWAEEGS